MKKRLLPATMGLFVAVLAAVVLTSVKAEAFNRRPCGPRYCLDVYDPVYCPGDGQTYPNACYAARACQYNCLRGW